MVCTGQRDEVWYVPDTGQLGPAQYNPCLITPASTAHFDVWSRMYLSLLRGIVYIVLYEDIFTGL